MISWSVGTNSAQPLKRVAVRRDGPGLAEEFPTGTAARATQAVHAAIKLEWLHTHTGQERDHEGVLPV